MTQPNGGPNSARGFISAAARSKRVKEAAQKDKRTARANLTPWQQALLYENRANPYPFYAELRKTPVSRQPDGSYVVSTYREIVSILHDPRVSSDPRKRANGLSAGEAAAEASVYHPEPSMITSDPPEHDRMRRATMRHFGPPHSTELVSSQEAEIKRIVAGLLDKLKAKNRIDFVDEFAYPLPVTVICDVLGVPRQDEPRFHGWIQAFMNGLDLGPEAATEEQKRLRDVGNRGRQELRDYMRGLLEKYAKQPGPGMLSAMVNDKSEEHLSHGELVSNAMLLLFAGHETTVNLIAHSVLTLLRHEDALEKLRRRPELIVPGVEEFLRFESSVQFWPTRCALEDIEIAGTTIPKGAPVIPVYGSANRDPSRFTNPDQVYLERKDNEHLGYSSGIHLCFGGPLARLEAQIAVGEFVRRIKNPRLVVDPPPYRHNQIFRGPRHVLIDIDGVSD
jgi:cytochrome P450